MLLSHSVSTQSEPAQGPGIFLCVAGKLNSAALCFQHAMANVLTASLSQGTHLQGKVIFTGCNQT